MVNGCFMTTSGHFFGISCKTVMKLIYNKLFTGYINVNLILGTDYNDKDNCIWGGLLLGCTASRSSSPWHNFVSDKAHWKVENGATPCQNNKGFIPVGSNIPFISALNSLGAKKIWNNNKIAIMRGSPGKISLLHNSNICTYFQFL